jgi:hypothetical protein
LHLQGLGKLKKSNDLIGTQIHDLPACSIVPQLTTLSRAPYTSPFNGNYHYNALLSVEEDVGFGISEEVCFCRQSLLKTFPLDISTY